jgi:hypothetical protein
MERMTTKPRYSVMRIETAKQQCLKGERWHKPQMKDRLLHDWTDDDERKLVEIFKSFDVQHLGVPTHKQLNEAIDNIRFSGGIHAINTGLANMILVDHNDGMVSYKEYTQQWGFENDVR